MSLHRKFYEYLFISLRKSSVNRNKNINFGKTPGESLGREEGGELGMGNTCKSMADSCKYMAKTTTIL